MILKRCKIPGNIRKNNYLYYFCSTCTQVGESRSTDKRKSITCSLLSLLHSPNRSVQAFCKVAGFRTFIPVCDKSFARTISAWPLNLITMLRRLYSSINVTALTLSKKPTFGSGVRCPQSLGLVVPQPVFVKLSKYH